MGIYKDIENTEKILKEMKEPEIISPTEIVGSLYDVLKSLRTYKMALEQDLAIESEEDVLAEMDAVIKHIEDGLNEFEPLVEKSMQKDF